jgi:hypothetical protein
MVVAQRRLIISDPAGDKDVSIRLYQPEGHSAPSTAARARAPQHQKGAYVRLHISQKGVYARLHISKARAFTPVLATMTRPPGATREGKEVQVALPLTGGACRVIRFPSTAVGLAPAAGFFAWRISECGSRNPRRLAILGAIHGIPGALRRAMPVKPATCRRGLDPQEQSRDWAQDGGAVDEDIGRAAPGEPA